MPICIENNVILFYEIIDICWKFQVSAFILIFEQQGKIR